MATIAAHSYLDLPGLTSRANSAMLRIEMIMARTDVSSAARLALIAGVMVNEPVLTDGSTAAHIARREARQRGEYSPLRCMCPDDCACHSPYRTTVCGCTQHAE